MADPAQIPTIDDGPSLVVEPISPSPVSPAPSAAPAVATAAPASVEVPPSSPPEAGAPAVPDAAKPVVTLPSEVPSLLEEASLDGKPKVEGPKPAEPEKKADEVKAPEEPKAPEPPKAPDPVEYKYELPESLKLDDATRTDLHKAFDDFRADPNVGAQKLIDLHNQTVTKLVEDIRRQQYETFNETRRQWAAQVAADAELGGAGFETTKRAIARMRDMFVPEADQKDFNEFLRVTGAGDHPAFFRMLHRAARFFDEPSMPPPNIKPPANIGKRPGGRSASDLYPNTTFK